MRISNIGQADIAAQAAGFALYGQDFLCRAMAILYCYGGGPGGEYFRTPLGQHVAGKAAETLDLAVSKKDWKVIKLFRKYVHELQCNRAAWLSRTLDRLNIPENVIKHKECLGAK